MAGISKKLVRELIHAAESLESVAESVQAPVEAEPAEAPSGVPQRLAAERADSRWLARQRPRRADGASTSLARSHRSVGVG